MIAGGVSRGRWTAMRRQNSMTSDNLIDLLAFSTAEHDAARRILIQCFLVAGFTSSRKSNQLFLVLWTTVYEQAETLITKHTPPSISCRSVGKIFMLPVVQYVVLFIPSQNIKIILAVLNILSSRIEYWAAKIIIYIHFSHALPLTLALKRKITKQLSYVGCDLSEKNVDDKFASDFIAHPCTGRDLFTVITLTSALCAILLRLRRNFLCNQRQKTLPARQLCIRRKTQTSF